jgi:hypothetical protein
MAQVTGPYIPKEHERYGLLPESREFGGEVFIWTDELDRVDAEIHKAEGEPVDDDGFDVTYLLPYGVASYDEYWNLLEGYAAKYAETDAKLSRDIERLEAKLKEMNVKENWSVVKFLGGTDKAPVPDELDGLTKGSYYYWPADAADPKYIGVIDNEEFTTYLYPTSPENWGIALDPLGIAAKALEEGAKNVPEWIVNPLMEEEELENEGY